MMEKITSDVLVIGGGPAGCFAAIKARQSGARNVLLVDKGYVGKSGCAKFAAGSFKAFIPDEDDFDLWFSKAIKDGDYINDQNWTKIHLMEVFERVKELDTWGVNFLKEKNGKYKRLAGSDFSEKRPIKTIMFRGPELMDVLRATALKFSIKIVDKTMVTHLLPDKRNNNVITGALGFDIRTGEHKVFAAKATILTGGGQAYKSHNAYQKMATGDVHVMGLRAGAELTNYEFCCHQLSHNDFDTTGMNVLMGLGATFVNAKGEAFMEKYDPEYRDRSTVNRESAAMAAEVRFGNAPLYLDFSQFDEQSLAYFQNTLPIVYRAFERAGYIKNGKIRERLEWVSVNMGNISIGGGLRINTQCETNLKGLYAAGDAAYGAAGGVDAMCACAIPFATTSGARSGISASEYIQKVEAAPPSQDKIQEFTEELSRPLTIVDGVDSDYLTLKFQELLFPMDIYLFRHQKRLQETLEKLCRLRDDIVPYLKAYDPHSLRMAIEAANMVACGELFLRAALARTESRGTHLREDYPYTDNINWLKWIILKEDDRDISISTDMIPFKNYLMKPEKSKYIHPVAEVMKREYSLSAS